jgi:hypothetical protein
MPNEVQVAWILIGGAGVLERKKARNRKTFTEFTSHAPHLI